MKTRNPFRIFTIALLLALTACGGGSGGTADSPPGNLPVDWTPIGPSTSIGQAAIDEADKALALHDFQSAGFSEFKYALKPMFYDSVQSAYVVANRVANQKELEEKGIHASIASGTLKISSAVSRKILAGKYQIIVSYNGLQHASLSLTVENKNKPQIDKAVYDNIQKLLSEQVLTVGEKTVEAPIEIGSLFHHSSQAKPVLTTHSSIYGLKTRIETGAHDTVLTISGTPNTPGTYGLEILANEGENSATFELKVQANDTPAPPEQNGELAALIADKTFYHFTAYQHDAKDWFDGIFWSPDKHTYYECRAYKFTSTPSRKGDGYKQVLVAKTGHIETLPDEINRSTASKCPDARYPLIERAAWKETDDSISIKGMEWGKEHISTMELLADDSTSSLPKIKVMAAHKVEQQGSWGEVSYVDKNSPLTFIMGNAAFDETGKDSRIEDYWRNNNQHSIFFNGKIRTATVTTRALSSYWSSTAQKTVAESFKTDIVFKDNCDAIGLEKSEIGGNSYIRPLSWDYTISLLHPRLPHEMRAVNSLTMDFAQNDAVNNTCTISTTQQGLYDFNDKKSIYVDDNLVVYLRPNSNSGTLAEAMIINTVIQPKQPE